MSSTFTGLFSLKNNIKTQRGSMNNYNQSESQEILRLPAEDVLKRFQTSEKGLQQDEAKKRLSIYGHNELAKKKRRNIVIEYISNYKNPLIIVLIICAIISNIFGQVINSIIIFVMILMSTTLNFIQEHRASKAAEKLKKRVATTATVIRNSETQEIKVSELVPGDIILLSAGDIVPADARLIDQKYLFVDQSALTGESAPADKNHEPLKTSDLSSVTSWANYLFMGTSVVSGNCTAVVVKTGGSTEYGEIVKKAIERAPETAFEKDLKKFSIFTTKTILMLVIFVFLVNALFKHTLLDSVLFAVALAVGLTPELLPMILSINLSKGSMEMSKKGVIVKRLSSIQNLGSMDVLCCDKTGTLTENNAKLEGFMDVSGKQNENVLLYAYLNSALHTGVRNNVDEAILKYKALKTTGYKKIDEIPFDFTRRKMSVIVEKDKVKLMITKGAPEEVLNECSKYQFGSKILNLTKDARKKIEKRNHELFSEGYRVIAVAYRKAPDKKSYSLSDEKELIFMGFVSLMDPPKKTAREAVQILEKSGITLKVLTGDNELVTKKVCEELNIPVNQIVLGKDLEKMSAEQISKAVENANIFARVTPSQKNLIIDALRKNNHIVGFMGDGINDAPSLKASDVSISVNNASDIAKESADIILLHKDLKVLHEGVLDGRKTFGNTMKYMMMMLSSNFGNMLSAAGASLFLPFLPMLPVQILLNNFLYDSSQLTIPTDNVDSEYVEKPKKFDIKFIKRFMFFFGPLSSIFDFLTFGVMLLIFHATEQMFQTAWFIESFCTQALIIFVIRTNRPFFKSRPGKILIYNVIAVLAIAVSIPFTPLGKFFKFVPLPISFLAAIALLVITYLLLVESLKKRFYR